MAQEDNELPIRPRTRRHERRRHFFKTIEPLRVSDGERGRVTVHYYTWFAVC